MSGIRPIDRYGMPLCDTLQQVYDARNDGMVYIKVKCHDCGQYRMEKACDAVLTFHLLCPLCKKRIQDHLNTPTR